MFHFENCPVCHLLLLAQKSLNVQQGAVVSLVLRFVNFIDRQRKAITGCCSSSKYSTFLLSSFVLIVFKYTFQTNKNDVCCSGVAGGARASPGRRSGGEGELDLFWRIQRRRFVRILPPHAALHRFHRRRRSNPHENGLLQETLASGGRVRHGGS